LGLSITSGTATLGTPANTTITITDDVDRPTVSFNTASYIPGEGNAPIDVRVELQGKTSVPVDVTFSVSGGATAPAIEGADYTLSPTNGILTFPADSVNTTQEQFIEVTIIDDVEVEPGVGIGGVGTGDYEVAVFELDDPQAEVTVGTPSSATVYIQDDDDNNTSVPDPNGPLPAAEVPTSYDNRYFQTGGPRSSGEWYLVEANQDHEFVITIPSDWPTGTPVSFDLFSPGVYNSVPGDIDEVRGAHDTNTTFTLTLKGDIAPLTGTPKTYNPDSSITNSVTNTASWDRLITIPGSEAAGNTYILNTDAIYTGPASPPAPDGRDTNGWGLYVGYDDDSDITTRPRDREGGSPIEVSIVRGTYQYTLPDGDPRCMVLYQFVDSSDFVVRNGIDTIAFHNFDVERADAEVWYYSPDDTVYRGTWRDANWNGPDGTSAERGEGDVIYNPAEGWWRLITCTNEGDQYIQEGITGKPTYLAPDGSLP
jgi:hypothetical protein